MKLLDNFCRWYMGRKQKVAQEAKKRIDDKKLKEAGDKLKALYEFVRFINEKCVRNRHERKTFWRNVSEGRPLVEETIINVLRRMGVKEESIKAIEDEKVNAIKQREEAEIAKKKQKEEQQKVNNKTCPTDCSNNCKTCANAPFASDLKRKEDMDKK